MQAARLMPRQCPTSLRGMKQHKALEQTLLLLRSPEADAGVDATRLSVRTSRRRVPRYRNALSAVASPLNPPRVAAPFRGRGYLRLMATHSGSALVHEPAGGAEPLPQAPRSGSAWTTSEDARNSSLASLSGNIA